MWPFRRNKTNDGTPPEVQDYYQAESRQRSGMAWLLGLGALVVTVLLVLGLFYGGRWVYRKVRTQDRPNTAQVQQENANNQGNEQSPESGQPGNQPENNPSTTPSPSPQPPSGTPSPAPTPAPAPTPGSTPTSGPVATNTQGKGTSDLPTTGPADNTAIFLLVSAVGYALHRRFSKTEQTES